MTTDSLRTDLDALPGVASSEVTFRDDETPVARVWLDGTRDGDEVRGLVDALLARYVSFAVPSSGRTQRRRSGLGRGLGDLLPNDEVHPVRVPVHFRPNHVQMDHVQMDAGHRQTIERVAVVETVAGVSVEIEDGAGIVHCEPVDGPGSIDAAVINGVRALLDISDDVRVNITDVESGEGALLLVTASYEGERYVGTAFVEHRRPYALARAGLACLRDI